MLRQFAQILLFLQCAVALPAGVKVINPQANNVVPNEYIVVLKSNLNHQDIEFHKSRINKVHISSSNGKHSGIQYNYTMPTLKGYSGEFDASTLQAIAKSPEVNYIELVTKYGINTYDQPSATWGLGRISHRNPGYTDYLYDENSQGWGATVYVVDTGVYTAHQQFQGRAYWGANFAGDGYDDDLNGHGTHCSGTIAGIDYGVAKAARIVAVKVLGADGYGTTSGIVAGMNWVYSNAKPYVSVVSMSLGGGPSQSMNGAAANLVAGGIHVAVAAGNDGGDASQHSPASEPSVITVGAIDEHDSRTSWSNYGPLVDIFAPGNNVLSSWIGSPTASKLDSGTSMATPHISGLLAYFVSMQGGRGLTPAAARGQLLNWAGQNYLSNIGPGSPNLLAFNGGGARARK